ncbi:MAG: Cdc6/Cdc18 family protein [Candidatus Hermodarchaeota archaeon]
MDEEEFLKELPEKSVFLQKSSLDLNYVPDKLLCREDAISSLIFNFRRILEEIEQPSINYLIQGNYGTGKTAVAKFFGRNFKKIADEKSIDILVEYFNCIHFRSMSKIVRELLAKYFHQSGRGFGDNEALKLILEWLIKEKKYLLLILDEVHLLSSEDIFSFLGISETFGHQNVKFSLILLSSRKEWMRVETADILSKLNTKYIVKRYTFDQVKSILKYRIELAFKKDVISAETLNFLSKIVDNNGSMTNGIRFLKQCGLVADKEGLDCITEDIINSMSNEMYPTLRVQIIEQLKEHELLTLNGIAHTLLNKDEPFSLVDEAFQEYQTTCEAYNIEPHTIKTFRKYFQTLSKLRVISSRTVRIEEAERGRHLEISLIDITPEKFKLILEEILEKKFF